MRNEPAPFNFSGIFPIEANSLSALNDKKIQLALLNILHFKKSWQGKNDKYKKIRSLPSLQEPESRKQSRIVHPKPKLIPSSEILEEMHCPIHHY